MAGKLSGSAIQAGTITLTQLSGGLNDTTNAAYGQANTAYGQANAAYGAANNRVLKAGDTMTGQLNISSGGLLVTGNVGIGTTSPSFNLQVNGSTGIGITGMANVAVSAIYIPTGGILGDNASTFEVRNGGGTSSELRLSSRGNTTFFTGGAGDLGTGTEKVRITNLGNVGIGTTTTPGKLTVGTATVTDNNSLVFNRGVKPSIAASQAAILTEWNGIGSSECMTLMADAYKWLDDTGNTEWMRITSAGNFGFGTSSPVSTSLNGSATFYKIHNNDSASIPSTSAQAYDVNQSNLFLFGRNSGITIVSKFNEGGHILFGDEDRARSGGIEYSHTTDALTIVTNGSERGRFTTAGDFLVGTTNSDIGGSVAGIRLAPSGKMLASTNTASGLFYDEPLYLDRRDTSGDGTCIVLARHGYYKAGIGVVRGAAVGSEGSITFSTATNSGFNERMRINSSGNVGIGTSPATYSRLHVYGSTGAISSPGLIYSQNADDASALYISNNGTTAQYDRAVFEVYTANGSTNLFKILNGGAISTPRNPAFFARRTTGFTLSAGSTVIVYDSEVGDRTSNYNNSNGRFTAPVAGYYFFRAHVQPTTSGVSVNITFYVNGSLISYQNVGTTNLYARGDIINDIVYPLNQSDYVEVVVTVSSTCGFDNHGTFGGYLVG